MESNMENNESSGLIVQATILQQQSEETEQNLSFINEQLSELQEFSKQIKFLSESRNNEIFSSIGRGVYAKSSLSDNNLFVNAGSGVLVKKTREETKNIIDSQIEKLNEARIQLMSQMEMFNLQLHEMVEKIEKIKSKK